jgi:hypothetical protein
VASHVLHGSTIAGKLERELGKRLAHERKLSLRRECDAEETSR